MTRWLARSAALIGLALLVTGLVVSPWQRLAPVPDHLGDWVAQLVNAVAFGFVGIAIAERAEGRNTRVGWALLVTGWCQAATFATSAYLARPGRAPAAVAWFDGWLWAPAVVTVLVVLPALYPTGEPVRRWLALLPLGVFWVAVTAAAAAYEAWPGRGLPGALVAALAVGVAFTSLAGLGSLVLRYRSGSAQVRGQVRWLVWALLLLVSAELTVPLLPTAVADGVLLALPVLVPVAVGIAVLSYELFDIDLLLSRTLTYLVASAILLGIYLGLVLAVEQRLSEDEATRAGALAVLVVALLASPLRDLIQRVLRERLWGPAADRQRALAALTRQLGASPSVRDSPGIVAETLAATLRAPVQLLAGSTVVASVGELDHVTRSVAVEYSGRQVGQIRLGRRAAGPLDSRQERMLHDIAGAVGPVLDALLLTNELRDAGTRIIEVREAERARLHRDLHDGLGPGLAGLALGLDAARSLVRRAPAEAEAVLERLGEIASGATAEVRRVVDALRPQALDALDLAGAIRCQVELAGVQPAVVVCDEELPSLPGETEAVALRVALEAVTNVRRHAAATRCEVGLCVRDGALLLVVDDDGCGLPVRRTESGVGLGSMRDRVEGVGGTLMLSRSPLGGARVLARIPLAVPS